jgi:hypothetical protein
MTKKPRERHDYDGTPMSEIIKAMPSSLNDLPVGMWVIVDDGRRIFGLEGLELTDFVRRCIHALVDAGAKPIADGNSKQVNKWELQPQYGRSKHEIAEAVIKEWLEQGAPTPKPWTGLWFGLPWSYLPDKK